ncbi:MAG: OsmC family protein [Woeseia sp.]
MAKHKATITWERGTAAFVDNQYSRAHEWHFDGGAVVPASASPHIVPEPQAIAANVDPEEAFVAALSSCHMLFFLSLAAEQGIVVDAYLDKAEGVLGKNATGNLAMTDVALRPAARYAGAQPVASQIAALHDEAHRRCFIANSVNTRIRVQPVS